MGEPETKEGEAKEHMGLIPLRRMLQPKDGQFDPQTGRRLDPPQAHLVPMNSATDITLARMAPGVVSAAISLAEKAPHVIDQTVFLTAYSAKNGYHYGTTYYLRATWTQPLVFPYEYVYIYDHEPPAIGQEAGPDYWNYVQTYSAEDHPANRLAMATGGKPAARDTSYLFGSNHTFQDYSNFWAAYVRYTDNKYIIVARTKQHFNANNRWMGNVLRDAPSWGKLKLNEIFLPGSHDTGTFDMVDRGIPNTFNQTQSRYMIEQLNDGIRWLDIRMGYYAKEEGSPRGPFYLVHASYSSWTAWSDALKDILSWLEANPTEILVIRHQFEGDTDKYGQWTPALRTRVLQMSYDALKSCNPLPADKPQSTINEMLAAKQRVVLATLEEHTPVVAEGGNPIFKGNEGDWFNKYYIPELLPALDDSLLQPRSWMWASGTVVTPHAYDGTIPWGVFSLTMDAIDYMNFWIRKNAQKLNIVSVDFAESSVALALVEEFNRARAPRA